MNKSLTAERLKKLEDTTSANYRDIIRLQELINRECDLAQLQDHTQTQQQEMSELRTEIRTLLQQLKNRG